MNRVYEFLKAAETYYLATVEGNQPRVRPFGTVHLFEGKLYIVNRSCCFLGFTNGGVGCKRNGDVVE